MQPNRILAMKIENLIRMSNQIALNFGAYPAEVATTKVVNHLTKFWERRMVKELSAYVENNGSGIQPVVAQAVKIMRSSGPHQNTGS
jgi:formate dehydrogenase subunit delta